MSQHVDPMLAAAQSAADAAWAQACATWWGVGVAAVAVALNAGLLLLIYKLQHRDAGRVDRERKEDRAAAGRRRLAVARLNAPNGMMSLERATGLAAGPTEGDRLLKVDLRAPLETSRHMFDLVLTAEVYDTELRATVQRADALATRMEARLKIGGATRAWISPRELIADDANEVAELAQLRNRQGEIAAAEAIE